MRAIFLIALRNLTYRPGRSVSCILGIALGLAIVMAVLIVDHNTILTESALRPKSYGEPDIEIRPLRPDPAKIEVQRSELGACKGLMDLAALFFDISNVGSIRSEAMEVQLCGVDERAAQGFNAYRVKEGEDLDFSGPPNLLLSQKAKESLKVKPGDIVKVWLSHPVRNVCKDGQIIPMKSKEPQKPPLIMDFKVKGILAKEHLGLRNIAVAPFNQALNLFEGQYLLPIFWAKLAPGFDLTEVQTQLKDAFSVDKPYRRALVGESLEEKAFRNGVRVCAMLSLLLGLYIIFNSMSMSLVERIRQIGLLRAMGLTRRGLTYIFLLEGFILSLAGCCCSVVFTAIIVYYMKARNITTLGFGHPMEILDIPYLQLAGVMILGVVFSLLGVIYPVGKAWNLSVIQAIRKGTIEFERQPFKGVGRLLFFLYVLLIPMAYFVIAPLLSGRFLEIFLLMIYVGTAVAIVIGLLLFFPSLLHSSTSWIIAPLTRVFRVTGKLAQNSMRTARLRVFSTVSGLTLVFAAIFVISSITDSLLSETASWSDEHLLRTVFVKGRVPGKVKDQELLKIKGLQGVLNLSASIRSPFPVRGLQVEEMLKFGLFKGRTDMTEFLKKEDWIIVSTRLAKIYNYGVNGRVKLSTPLAGLKVFKICAIDDGYGFFPDDRGIAMISADKMASYFCVTADPGDRWSLYLHEETSPEAVAKALETRLGDRARIILGQNLKELYLKDLHDNFSIFKVIIGLVAILSGVSILNSLVIAVVERRRETALLRVVGLTPGQLKSILLMEAYSLGSLGGLFGLLLGLPITLFTVEGLGRISHLDLELTLKVETILITFLGALLVSLCASIYPILRQGRTDLMEAVKYE